MRVNGGAVTGEGFEMGMRAGTVAGVVYVAIVSTAICIRKSLGFGWYVLAIFLSPILAVFGGVLLGLIPTAFLTTRPNARDYSPDVSPS